MERALSFQTLIDGKVFRAQEALAEAMGLSKGQVSEDAESDRAAAAPGDAIGALVCRQERKAPIEPAYQLSTPSSSGPGAEGGHPAGREESRARRARARARPAEDALKVLIGSLDRSKKFPPDAQAVQRRRRAARRRSRAACAARSHLAFAEGLQGLEKAECS